MARPTRMHDVLHVTTDGREVTVRDRILDAITAGNYIECAAALAGIHKDTFYEWLKVGAQASADLHSGRRTEADLTEHDHDCRSFSDAVVEAQARSEARDVAQLAELARGGRKIESSTVKKDAAGNVVETTTRTEVAEPSAAVLQWRLERRFPDKWGRRRIEVSGPDGEPIPVEARVAGLVAAARAFHGAEVEADDGDEPEVELPADAADE